LNAIEALTGQPEFAALIEQMQDQPTWHRARADFVTALSAYLEDEQPFVPPLPPPPPPRPEDFLPQERSDDAMKGGIRRHGFARFRHHG